MPEFGPFKLVHTNPDFSTSGLSAVVAEYFFATGKREGLTERQIRQRWADQNEVNVDVLEAECRALMQEFFRERRNKEVLSDED